jgi:hypothetical protein
MISPSRYTDPQLGFVRTLFSKYTKAHLGPVVALGRVVVEVGVGGGAVAVGAGTDIAVEVLLGMTVGVSAGLLVAVAVGVSAGLGV